MRQIEPGGGNVQSQQKIIEDNAERAEQMRARRRAESAEHRAARLQHMRAHYLRDWLLSLNRSGSLGSEKTL